MNLSSYHKRIVGLILIIIFGIVVAMSLLGIIYATLINRDLEAAGSLAFLIFLFYFPLHYGIRLYKRSKSEALTLNYPVNPNAQLVLTVNINLAAYRKLLFQLSYNKLFYVYITAIGILILGYLFIEPPAEFSASLLIPLITLLIPMAIYFQASKSYYATKTLKEEIIFKINAETIKVFGQTFSSTISWKSLYKVKESKKWFLLYSSNAVAYFLPKECFATSADIDLMRDFAINTPSILKELK